MLSVTVGIELWLTIMIIGVVAMVYNTVGGMRAVIVTDIFQMAVLVVGIVVCCGFAWYHLGDWNRHCRGCPRRGFKPLIGVDMVSATGEPSDSGLWFLEGFSFTSLTTGATRVRSSVSFLHEVRTM